MTRTSMLAHLRNGFSLLALPFLLSTGACQSGEASPQDPAATGIDHEARASFSGEIWGECTPEDCGGRASKGTCWCDNACEYYGDCCKNETEVCGDACVADADCSDAEYCARPSGTCGHWGNCEPRPERCIEIYDPVCGCDGQTYSNECYANAAGTTAAHEGACQAACTTNDNCNNGQYCATNSGSCGSEGVCEPTPEACPDIWTPVCGCDGNTYSNECYAASAGVSVAYNDECTGTCTDNAECAKDQYCARDTGSCGATGSCVDQPTFCTKEYNPVCGCDGTTYGNACMAASAGVSIEHLGECAESCGGLTDKACSDHTQCFDDPNDDCDPENGGADCSGLCRGFCGGFSGFPCEDGYKCVDDPNDACNPEKGGSDCPGICVE